MDGRTSLLLALILALACPGCRQAQRCNSFCPVEESDGQSAKLQPKPATIVAWAACREGLATNKDVDPAQKRELYDQARRAYIKALETNPKFLPAYTGLARVYMKLDQMDHALETFLQALRVFPNEASLWFDLGICHCRAKQWELGIRAVQKAQELDPDNRLITQTLGFCLARAGHVQESMDMLAKVMTPAEVHFNIARMLYQIGNDDMCRQHLRLALQLDSAYGPAKNMLDSLERPLPPSLPPTSTPAANGVELQFEN